MKKILFSLVCTLCLCNLWAQNECDAMVTKENFQIQCIINSINDSVISYLDCSDGKTLSTMSVSNIRKVYRSNGEIWDYTKGVIPAITQFKPTPEATPAEPTPAPVVPAEPKKEEGPIVKAEVVQPAAPVVKAVDIIITNDARKIEATITEVSASAIRYKDGNDAEKTLAVSEVSSVIYANGRVSVFEQPKQEIPVATPVTPLPATPTPPPAQQIEPQLTADISLGRVSTYNGLLVFNDCEPVSRYEVIGEVSINNLSPEERAFASSQYQGLRDALIKAAKMANNQAEGVILTLVNGGIDKAHIIKFKDASEDHSLARAKRYRGVYIFCDCKPLNSYRYLGDLKGKFTLNPQYTVLRDDMLKKCVKHYDNANGIILHLVLGGKDTAEAIKF